MENNDTKGESTGHGAGSVKDDSREKITEALKKCLEENKDDYSKCKSKIDALRSSSSSSSASRPRKRPLNLPSGSLTDV